ncbi:MAG: TraB/GumN family protein, partial [Bacteroidota bacterium]
MKIAKIGAISLLMGLLTLFTFMLPAQSSDALLWKISGNGLEAPSYLFGTIHLLCPEDLKITDPVQQALDASDQLVCELDFDDPDLMATMQQYMRLPADQSPQDLYTEAERALLDSFLTQRMGMGMAQLGSIKPFFLSSMLIPGMMKCQPASWELRLATIAKESNREMLGLETVAEQMAVVDGMGYEVQAD